MKKKQTSLLPNNPFNIFLSGQMCDLLDVHSFDGGVIVMQLILNTYNAKKKMN